MKTKWKDLKVSVPPLNKPIFIWDGKEVWKAKFRKDGEKMSYRFYFLDLATGEKPPKVYTHWCEIPRD